MKILITGAHFTPAKAVIEELKKRADVKIVYIGRATTMEGDSAPSVESSELPKLKIRYLTITAGRLRRSFDIYTIFSLLKIPIGIIQAIYILLREKPDVILSFGGYVGVPISLAGWLFYIPIIIHEQSLTKGLANKISGVFADRIALSFKGNCGLKEKEVLTGNPLREEIFHPANQLEANYSKIFSQSRKAGLPVILIYGGNQGSHAINTAVEQSLQKLLKKAFVIHQTGESKFGDFERLNSLRSDNYLPVKWIGKDIGLILSKVDLAICRAGINTLMELAYLGVPGLCIPIEGHFEQNFNADYFQKIGLVKKLSQSKLSADTLVRDISLMLKNLSSIKQKAKNTKSVVIEDASKRVALETILLALKENHEA